MGYSDSFQTEIALALSKEKVLVSKEARACASKDETHGLEPIVPSAVLLPCTHEDVVNIAKICTKHGVFMTPRGAGTGKSGGCVPVQGGVVVDFSKMNKIISVNAEDFTVVVEPGVILADLQRHVEAMGLYYPPDPASLEWCTIGGNIAENAGGPCAVKYGVTKDYVLGLNVVLPSGESHFIGKNTIKGVTGLDLVSLMCGSEGVLAFVTQATLRLIPKPKCSLAAWFNFTSRKAAINAVSAVREYRVKCIEFVDYKSLQALIKIGVPNRWPMETQAVLLIEVDGDDNDQLHGLLAKIDENLRSDNYLGAFISKDEGQRQDIWRIRHRLSEATKKLAKHKISEDIVVPLSKMNELLNCVEKIAERYAVKTCAFGHAGDGNLHLQFFFDKEPSCYQLPQMLEEIFLETVRCNGTLSGEHGVGLAKKSYLGIEQSTSLIELQKMLKKVFDPSGILNPGKFI